MNYNDFRLTYKKYSVIQLKVCKLDFQTQVPCMKISVDQVTYPKTLKRVRQAELSFEAIDFPNKLYRYITSFQKDSAFVTINIG